MRSIKDAKFDTEENDNKLFIFANFLYSFIHIDWKIDFFLKCSSLIGEFYLLFFHTVAQF